MTTGRSPASTFTVPLRWMRAPSRNTVTATIGASRLVPSAIGWFPSIVPYAGVETTPGLLLSAGGAGDVQHR